MTWPPLAELQTEISISWESPRQYLGHRVLSQDLCGQVCSPPGLSLFICKREGWRNKLISSFLDLPAARRGSPSLGLGLLL